MWRCRKRSPMVRCVAPSRTPCLMWHHLPSGCAVNVSCSLAPMMARLLVRCTPMARALRAVRSSYLSKHSDATECWSKCGITATRLMCGATMRWWVLLPSATWKPSPPTMCRMRCRATTCWRAHWQPCGIGAASMNSMPNYHQQPPHVCAVPQNSSDVSRGIPVWWHAPAKLLALQHLICR